ncbi:acyltransferase [Chelatococcus reniformis]|uniref:Acyltransferase n=2 Tax=Chelatococcus reniformis TaxID=1494448 RepID=A0A916UCR2_9HYPH|nr:acyltransferase [Chelatococcus reniformis]
MRLRRLAASIKAGSEFGMIVNVQVLRFVAAVLVVWVHAQDMIASNVVPNWASQLGYSGVDLFFVISGLIMVRTAQTKHVGPVEFLRRRVRRIVPLYYVFTLVTFAIALMAPSLLKSTVPDLGQLAASLAFIPFEKSPDRIYPVYFLGWTLNFEMFFYCAFAASLLLPKRARVPVLVALLAALALAGTAISRVTDFGVVAFIYTRPIVLDFAAGMLIAAAMPRARPSSRPTVWWISLAAGIVWLAIGTSIFPIGTGPAVPITDTFLSFGLASTLIVAGAVGLERSGAVIASEAARRGGDASYSIYLTHFYVIGIAITICNRLALGDGVRLALLPIAIAAAVLAGVAVYKFVERPLTGDVSAFRRLGGLLRPAAA